MAQSEKDLTTTHSYIQPQGSEDSESPLGQAGLENTGSVTQLRLASIEVKSKLKAVEDQLKSLQDSEKIEDETKVTAEEVPPPSPRSWIRHVDGHCSRSYRVDKGELTDGGTEGTLIQASRLQQEQITCFFADSHHCISIFQCPF